ncbi:MAG: hypothetical protein E7Z63_00870 [Thermoplasmata archaeon]|nr:hypothetical protein [Thermoplasmata archaeon]
MTQNNTKRKKFHDSFDYATIGLSAASVMLAGAALLLNKKPEGKDVREIKRTEDTILFEYGGEEFALARTNNKRKQTPGKTPAKKPTPKKVWAALEMNLTNGYQKVVICGSKAQSRAVAKQMSQSHGKSSNKYAQRYAFINPDITDISKFFGNRKIEDCFTV